MLSKKQHNFWLVYKIISIIFIFLFIILAYNLWNANKNRYKQELINTTRIVSQNTISSFYYQESTLKILGQNLLALKVDESAENGRATIEEMIKINKGLVAAFGLAKYNGQLVLVSTLPPKTKLPNLMKVEKAKASFDIARKSNKMQLGRVYFMKKLQKWVIPIRIALKNKKGETPYVMTAGIKVNGGSTALNIKEIPKDFLIQIIRGDGYIQFQNPIKKENYENVYNTRLDKKHLPPYKSTTTMQYIL